MKKAVICIITFSTCCISFAQRYTFNDYLKKDYPRLNFLNPHAFFEPTTKNKYPFTNKRWLRSDNSVEQKALNNATLYGLLPNGNKLYRLPLDNMICIVPDMSQFNMPVIRGSDFGDPMIIR